MSLKIILIIIGFINPQEQSSFEYYASNMRQQYEAVGAVIIDKYPIQYSVFGGEKPDFIMMVEFPNQAAFEKLFAGDEYKKLVPFREKGFNKLNVFVSQR
jgi:uncharacterized protein (DUF1330 family)